MKTRYVNELITFPDLPRFAEKARNPNAQWFSIKNQTAESADIYIYDEISPYIPQGSAQGVVAQLNGLKDVKQINVRINSPGGSVFEGVAIYNALARHPGTVVTHVDGIAASIASVIAMAGKELLMADNAMMMIHNPMAFTFGSASELRKEADVLDQIKETIINVYAQRSGKKRETLAKLMDEETWMTAQEAVDGKFADKAVKAMKVAACNFKDFNYKVPTNLADSLPASTTSPGARARARALALLERSV